MPVTITSDYNDSYHSPGFDLGVFGLTGYDKLSIERVDVAGEFQDAPVRGADGVSIGGTTFGASDYEAPIGNAAYFRATATAQTFLEDWNRSFSGGFGVGPFELPWTLVDGTAVNFNVTPGLAAITMPAPNVAQRIKLVGSSFGDMDVRYTVRSSAIATGADINAAFLSHYQSSGNYYGWYVIFRPSGVLDFALLKFVSSSSTTVISQLTVGSYTANNPVNVRLQRSGVDVRAKIWTGATEPASWSASSSDSTYSGGEIGLQAVSLTGNTNTSPKASFGPLQIQIPDGDPAISTVVDSIARIIPADDPGTVYLKSTGQPALSRRVNVVDLDEVSRPGRIIGEYEVLGRRNKVVITDVLGGREGSFTVATFPVGNTWWSDSYWRDIQVLLENGGTLLLQTSGPRTTGEEDMYLVVKNVGKKRIGVVGGELVHLHTIGYVEVDRPASAGEIISIRTWQDVINQNATWNDVLNNHPTWLDVLQRNL